MPNLQHLLFSTTDFEQTPLNRCQLLPAPYKQLLHDIYTKLNITAGSKLNNHDLRTPFESCKNSQAVSIIFLWLFYDYFFRFLFLPVRSFIISEISSFALLIGRTIIFLRWNFVVRTPDWLHLESVLILFITIFVGKSQYLWNNIFTQAHLSNQVNCYFFTT